MPFINGRFYMNPAYGRSVDQARAAEAASNQPGPQQQDPNAHWVTMDGRHVLIHESQAERLQMREPTSEKERYLAIVVFNETGGLSASAKTGKGSAENLYNARIAVAEVANRLRESGHPEQVAAGEGGIYTGLWKGLANGNKDSVSAWNDSVEAARTALAGSNTTNGATHFRLDAKSGAVPSWARGKSPSKVFGRFRNAGGGDAAPTPHVYLYR